MAPLNQTKNNALVNYKQSVCLLFSQNPFTDNGQQRSVKMLSMNTWDVAVSLTNCDWSLFSNVHEVNSSHFRQCSTREGVLERISLKYNLN